MIKGTDLYDTIDVGLNLKLNFDQVTTNETNYSAQGDRDEGLIKDFQITFRKLEIQITSCSKNPHNLVWKQLET